MFNWLTKFLTRKKVVDARAFLGVDWPGSFVDAFRRVAKPTKDALVKEYKGWAYICSNYNTGTVVATGLHLYRRLQRGEKCRWHTKTLTLPEVKHLVKTQKLNLASGERVEEILDHPALTLLSRPNPQMTGLEMAEFTQLYQEMTGEGAWHVVYNDFGGAKVPVALYLLQPQHLKAEEDPKTGFVDHYTYGFKESVRLETDEVVRFTLPNLRSPYLAGHAPLLGVYEDVNILDLYKATEAAILSTEGRPDIMISGKDGIAEPDRLEKKWTSKFRRGGQHGLLVVDDDITVTPLQYSPRDLAFTKVGEAARQSVCLSYGIPPILLSEEGASQYDVDSTVSNRHVKTAIVPRLNRNLDILNNRYLPLWDDSGLLFFGYDDPSVVNQEQELDRVTKLVGAGVMLPNEARADYGLDPKPWGENPAGMYSGNAPAPGPGDEDGGESVNDQDEAAQEGNIQATALNGTQIASLLQIVEGVTTGLLTAEAARLVIAASFPLIDGKLVCATRQGIGKDQAPSSDSRKHPAEAPRIDGDAPGPRRQGKVPLRLQEQGGRSQGGPRRQRVGSRLEEILCQTAQGSLGCIEDQEQGGRAALEVCAS